MSDTEGGGGRDGNGVDEDRDWASAKREDKRIEMTASWNIDVDIIESAVLNVVEVRKRKRE